MPQARPNRLASSLSLLRSVCAAALLSCAGLASAAPAAGEREFNRRFDTRRLEHRFAATLTEPLALGQDAELRISLETQLTGQGQGKAARAGLINGYVALVLPPEIEALGELRLYYVDAQGGDQLLYSASYPRLARFAAEPEPALTAATPTLFHFFNATAQALDPAASVFLPVDSTLRGNSRTADGGSILRCAWSLPVDVRQKRLLGLFDPESSGAAPAIAAKVRLRASRPAEQLQLKLYAGALSIAGAVVDAPPSLMPPGAIALHELDPQRYPAPPSPPAPAPAQDGKATEVAAPPPAPIPMLVYSAEWLSWEEQLPLAQLGPAQPPAAALPRVDGRPQPAAGNSAAVEIPVAPTAPPAIAAAPSTAVEPAQGGGGTTARQVELGTLPAAGTAGEVALKPITGSAGQRASQDAAQFGASSSGANLPPQVGYPGSMPGSTRFYGPGGPENVHGGGPAPPPMAAPGLGTMVLVPAGDFLMGTDAGTPYGDADELPQHTVYLPDYFIDKYPVTNRQFGEFVVLAGYQPEGDWQRYSNPGVLDMPVRNVSWNDANAYARWAGKRLPTEAEWEKAARGSDGRLFPWGNEWNADILPRGELSYALLTAPKAASPCGALAMVGMLWQWTATPWHEYPFNPDARGDKLILRGGAFSNGRNIVRCANRYFEPPQVALNTFGFRCVKDKP